MRPKKFIDPIYVHFNVEREFYKKIQDVGNSYGNISNLIRKSLEKEIALFEKAEANFAVELQKQIDNETN